jgi:hypothetical protein
MGKRGSNLVATWATRSSNHGTWLNNRLFVEVTPWQEGILVFFPGDGQARLGKS